MDRSALALVNGQLWDMNRYRVIFKVNALKNKVKVIIKADLTVLAKPKL